MELTKEEKFSLFMECYSEQYDDDWKSFLEEAYLETPERRMDIVHQIDAYLGFLDETNNRYLGYLKKLKQYFSLEQDILEIGGGHFPTMAYYIDQAQAQLQQKTKVGTITTYDEHLVTTKLGSIKLKKESFTEYHFLENYQLVVGIMPCEATELIVRKSCEEQKDFFLAFCGCIHFSSDMAYINSFSGNEKCFQDYIYHIASTNKEEGSVLIKDYLDSSYGVPYPILIKKKM